jgi:Ca2+-binding RTX toxin-like protein
VAATLGGAPHPDNPTNNIYGTDGADSLTGTSGSDLIHDNGGDDTVRGGDGDDLFRAGKGTDYYDGGAGSDRVSFFEAVDAPHGVIVSLATQTIYDDGYGNLEHMTSIEGLGDGTMYPDIYIGDANANLFLVGKGDIALGAGGDDGFQIDDAPAFIDGGSGINTIEGFSGFRQVDRDNNGVRDPLLDYATHGVTVDLSRNMVVDDGFGGSGFVFNIQNVVGGGLDDRLIGDHGDNVLDGAFGNDTLSGGAGADLLHGGANDDVLTGGAGKDVFWFDNQTSVYGDSPAEPGHDVITDFHHGQDTIRITGVTGASSFSALTIASAGGDTTITYGLGNTIYLPGVSSVSASDFIFV